MCIVYVKYKPIDWMRYIIRIYIYDKYKFLLQEFKLLMIDDTVSGY